MSGAHLTCVLRIIIIFASLPVLATAVEGPNLRLDNSVVPTHYSVQLTVTPDSNTFEASIDIDVKVNRSQPVIWLNALNLDLKRATVAGQTASIVPGNKAFVGLRFNRLLAPGPVSIHIDYSGKISRNSSAGVFQLQDRGNWYVYTQFESTDARRAFPCFDQPDFKTTWDIALKVPQALTAFANTPEVSNTPQASGTKLVRFATTRPLPSYLVAFAVGPFDVVKAGTAGKNKTALRILMPRGHTGEAEFAAGAIPELLTLLEDYFGMPFPYQKLDSIVMPVSNFAMENAGLITYGADLLLSDPKKDSIRRQRICAIVAAHEMAHQWFGDLVTTAWWDDIWLNEAFATWLEGKIVGRWRPAWHMEVQAAEDMLGVMRQDRLASARKIRQPIESENDIANAFDGITYQKGAAVISMFEHWIGEDKFRNGVRQYISDNADKNATAQQFLAALSKGAGRDVAPAFSTFLNQSGTPVVSVSLDCSSAKPQVKLEQSRYLPAGSTAPRDQLWSIPVCVRYWVEGKVQSDCTLLAARSSEMVLTRASSCPAWVLGNDAEASYYRVAYSGSLLEHLVTNSHELTTAEKAGLLSDVHALVDAGGVAPSAALALVPKFANEPRREVVGGAIGVAELATGHFVDANAIPLGRQFIAANFAQRAEQLGWRTQPGDDDERKLLRLTLVPFAVTEGGDRKLADDAVRLAREWLKDPSVVDPDMAGPLLPVAARVGDGSLFDAYLAAAKSAKDSRQRRTILGGLGRFSDPALVRRAFGLLLNGEFDLREAFYPILFGPLDRRETDHLPFEFVREHIAELMKVLPGEVGSDMAAALPQVGAAFCDASSRAAFDEFFRDRVKTIVGGPRTLAQQLERIDLCIQQKAKLGPQIDAFLRANVSGTR